MTNFKTLLFTFICLVLLQGCMAQNSGQKRASKKNDISNPNTTNPPTFGPKQALYWFTSEAINGTLTVNANSENIIYLRGSYIHNFLTSKTTSGIYQYQNPNAFCMVVNFPAPALPLRVKAIAISIAQNNTLERLFKVNLPSTSENNSSCGLTNINGVPPASTSTAYDASSICPACLGSISLTSDSIEIYEIDKKNIPATSTQISSAQLPLSNVGLKVDLSSTSGSESGLCSNTSCNSKGYDCCIDGQCVQDASMKSNVNSSTPGYSEAMSDFNSNPLNFIYHPNIFNVCTNIPHTPPPTSGGSDQGNIEDAKARVEKYKDDYKCIEGAQNSTPPNYSSCLPNNNLTSYESTKAKLAVACGCPATYDQATREIKCPNWGVRPVYKSSVESLENIVDFYCYTPPEDNQMGSIINSNIEVPSRSAPHRFFSIAGDQYDDPKKAASSVVQEGDDFYYQDTFNKAYPVNGKFNVNSILGKMNIALTGTNPAKKVDVELGQSYVISTTSGYFTPCPTCGKDAWLNIFRAHPQTTFGVGLRSAGYTTSRDTFSSNTTLGNYEDTKFGRACYLPVTMIPNAHQQNSNINTQRRDRLKTQAAYYVNGYQRDWFGFNKGAMIGSFDGVKWFAVGTGRRITATSNKLYLAINGAFFDLAENTNHIVNIRADYSNNTVSSYDYDPSLPIDDKFQNSAATCQAHHQCSNDADCVTQLGWEYSCVDITSTRTNWPMFNDKAEETPGQDGSELLVNILENTITLGSSNNRCVYRGAGAPCVRNLDTVKGHTNEKAMQCAPNFYCAAVTSTDFNTELARSPNEIDNILYGMEANILGRPLYYVGANFAFESAIISNISYNAGIKGMNLPAAAINEIGVCRPGKYLETDSLSMAPDLRGHRNKDSQKKTDFISQISSCNVNGSSFTRTFQCPAFDENLNIVSLTDNSISAGERRNVIVSKYMQNMCGKESQLANGTSSFSQIEAQIISGNYELSSPKLALDACLRRAGSICHSDLDCGPNKLHAQEASTLGINYFGKTLAEQQYWEEYLVCGQGTPRPETTNPKYLDYKLSENRCCREIGKDFTMYTSGNATLVPENAGPNAQLITSRLSAENPKADYRYSRYSTSKTAIDTITAGGSADDLKVIPNVEATIAPHKEQWKVLNETGSSNCCGGGWIRKFADGTHDWKVRNRFNPDATNFACLNYRSPLVEEGYNSFSADKISEIAYNSDSHLYCTSTGCYQIPFPPVSEYDIISPSEYKTNTTDTIWQDVLSPQTYPQRPVNGFTRMDTSPTEDPYTSSTYKFRTNTDVPFSPIAYRFPQYPFDLNDNGNPDIYFTSKDLDYGVSFYLPSYIQFNAAAGTQLGKLPANTKIYIKYFADGNPIPFAEEITANFATDAACSSVTNYLAGSSGLPVDAFGAGTASRWCITQANNRPLMHFKARTTATAWKYAGIMIEFSPLEVIRGTKTAVPGNMYYYLQKLGRFELLGIPQITYEPLYCNNNHDKVIPGFFTSDLSTRAQFNAASIPNYVTGGRIPENQGDLGGILNFGNDQLKFTYQNKVDHPAVFSANDFTCCTPAGKQTGDATKCCSGFGVKGNNETSFTCKLPKGTDLNVYFNKFVSSEGVGADLPEGGLVAEATTKEEVDFDEYTGEPKMRNSTFQKILALGQAFCDGGIVGNGGSFGQFTPQPNFLLYQNDGNEFVFPFSIVDSISDYDDNAGKAAFDNGFKWDHHYYCK